MVLIHSLSLLKQVFVPHVRRLAERYVTVLALSPEGRTRQVRLSHLRLAGLGLLGALLLGLAAWGSFGEFQVRSQQFRLASLEEENQLLLTQLQQQATLILALQGEMGKLRTFESQLRILSGLEPGTEPLVGVGAGGGRELHQQKRQALR
ncbi:MAG: hypothetical protein L0214_09215 [candidate division NC10 bacterium]|nr:hypothetical protein [candidate division NC10 bacterium]